MYVYIYIYIYIYKTMQQSMRQTMNETNDEHRNVSASPPPEARTPCSSPPSARAARPPVSRLKQRRNAQSYKYDII